MLLDVVLCGIVGPEQTSSLLGAFTLAVAWVAVQSGLHFPLLAIWWHAAKSFDQATSRQL
jgi:hypothetical protein